MDNLRRLRISNLKQRPVWAPCVSPPSPACLWETMGDWRAVAAVIHLLCEQWKNPETYADAGTSKVDAAACRCRGCSLVNLHHWCWEVQGLV